MQKIVVLSLYLLLLFSASLSWGLSPCPSDKEAVWTNCYGTNTWPDGRKYVGEWKDDEFLGEIND